MRKLINIIHIASCLEVMAYCIMCMILMFNQVGSNTILGVIRYGRYVTFVCGIVALIISVTKLKKREDTVDEKDKA